MSGRLASTDYIVVAGFAVINNADMIENTSAKGAWGVAGTAILSCLHVIQWFTARFTGNTSMAAGCGAIIYDTGMIKHRPEKAAGGMTDTTILVCWCMAARFAFGEHTIMAGTTVIYDANMIKACRYKTRGLVAVTAIIVGWHMVRWRNFSPGSCTIVA